MLTYRLYSPDSCILLTTSVASCRSALLALLRGLGEPLISVMVLLMLLQALSSLMNECVVSLSPSLPYIYCTSTSTHSLYNVYILLMLVLLWTHICFWAGRARKAHILKLDPKVERRHVTFTQPCTLRKLKLLPSSLPNSQQHNWTAQQHNLTAQQHNNCNE